MEHADLFELLDTLTGVYEAPPLKLVQGGFTDGALLGNGDVGIAIGGDHQTLAYYFGKNDFWTDDAALNQDGHRFNGVRPIMVAGIDLRIGRDGGTPYGMQQDIRQAEVRTSLSIDRSTVSASSWLAATENLLVIDLKSSGDEALPVTMELWCPGADAFPAKRWDTLHIQNGTYHADCGIHRESGWLSRATHESNETRWTCRSAMAVSVIGAEVRMFTDDDRRLFTTFNLEPGNSVRILTAIEGGKDRTDHVETALESVQAAAQTGVSKLHDDHLAWWGAFWTKSYIRLHDYELERYYYGALYNMACCSREGNVAPGLMGNWFTTDQPMCHSDYHLNYNYQAPFYGLYSANRLEQITPYYQPVLDYLPEGRWRARNEIEIACPLPFPNGVRGILYPVGIGPWASTPDDNYHNQVSDATFAAIPFIWHYEYTMDENFLQEKTYPLLIELADFWEDYLQSDDRNRYVVHAASYEGYQDLNPSQDLGFIRLLFRRLLNYSDLLGRDEKRHERWQDILDHLSEPPTTEYKGTRVYNHAESDEFLVGFTTDNIEWIFPGECLSLGDDPDKLRMAHDTIRLIDAWPQGNNVPKVFPQAVRVGYPVQEIIAQFKSLMQDRFRPNLTLQEDGGGIETAGSIITFNEMLLQSHEGFIRLFPVWFDERPASFVRLRARGAFLVSSSFTREGVTSIEIESEMGSECRILNPWMERPVVIETDAGESVSYQQTEGILSFKTSMGRRYKLLPRNGDQMRETTHSIHMPGP
jgi:alpha-L-fucosidase 2